MATAATQTDIQQLRSELDNALAEMRAAPSFDSRREAERCRRAWSRAVDEHERAAHTGMYAPVTWPLSEA